MSGYNQKVGFNCSSRFRIRRSDICLKTWICNTYPLCIPKKYAEDVFLNVCRRCNCTWYVVDAPIPKMYVEDAILQCIQSMHTYIVWKGCNYTLYVDNVCFQLMKTMFKCGCVPCQYVFLGL